jgi:hypothetical protein
MAVSMVSGMMGRGMSYSDELTRQALKSGRKVVGSSGFPLVSLSPEDWSKVDGPYCVLPREAHEDWEEAQRAWSAEMAAWGYGLRKIEQALLEAKAADRSRRVAASGLPLSATGAPVGDAPSKRAGSVLRRSSPNPRAFQVQLDLFEGASAPLGKYYTDLVVQTPARAARGDRG